MDLSVLNGKLEEMLQEVGQIRAEQLALRAELAGFRTQITVHMAGVEDALDKRMRAALACHSVDDRG